MIKKETEESLIVKFEMDDGTMAILYEGAETFFRIRTVEFEAGKWVYGRIVELYPEVVWIEEPGRGVTWVVKYDNLLEVSNKCPM